MIISAIVAVSKNNVIGKDNKMPWHLPADLAYFKKTTLGHPVILGRKNFDSIGKPLPGRTNIIVTRDRSFACTNCTVVHSLEEALLYGFQNKEDEVFIIGGGTIYEQSMDLWDKLYLTEIDTEMDGDVFFPEIDKTKWEQISAVEKEADEKNAYNLIFKVFSRVR
ncbi:MAG TPA: dihydrofolate reductase [Saprospiraceae bacterium]|nr:dihydrofolate reductase [Saprospiraceae bacterium]